MEGIVEVYAHARRRAARAGRRGHRRPRGRARLRRARARPFVDVTTRHIEAEIEAGRVLPLDAAGDRPSAGVDDGALPEPLDARRDAERDRRRHADDDLDPRALRRRARSTPRAVHAATAPHRPRPARPFPARPATGASGGRRTSPAASIVSAERAREQPRRARRRRCAARRPRPRRSRGRARRTSPPARARRATRRPARASGP